MTYDDINLRPIASKNLYELVETFVYKDIAIPGGFRFDGASIPGAFWQVIRSPFHPDVIVPALIHDWLYYSHIYDRETTDKLFVDLCKRNGINAFRCAAIHRAVRTFGGGYWNNNSDDIKFLLTLHEQQARSEMFFWPQEVLERI